MLERVRDFLRTESLSITIPVGFVVASAGLLVLRAFIYAFLSPIITEAVGRGSPNQLEFTIGDITFQYTAVLMETIVLAALLLILYRLFYRPPEADTDVDSGMRECPECRSDIVIDATRCAFCTSVVVPPATSVG